MHPILRNALPEDAQAAGTIVYSAFKAIAERHGFPPDFPNPELAIGLVDQLIARSDVHSVVAEVDGRVAGSNFLWEDGAIAGVGPITVDPLMQNSGVGRRLMEAVIERSRTAGIASVRLVQAGYHMRSLALYARLGFAVREPLSLLQGKALGLRIEDRRVRLATEADLEAANALCRRVHGLERANELCTAVAQGAASVVERDGRLSGYTTGIGFFGHSVGETTEDLAALIGAAPSFPGLGFFVPTRNAELLRWCLQQGLHMVQPMTLMTMGPYSEPTGAFMPSVLF